MLLDHMPVGLKPAVGDRVHGLYSSLNRGCWFDPTIAGLKLTIHSGVAPMTPLENGIDPTIGQQTCDPKPCLSDASSLLAAAVNCVAYLLLL